MALNRDGKSIAERRQELEEEAEEYASRGIVSPSLLKGARWFSRILWLAMSALVVVMIYQLNTRVPEADYKKLEKQAEELQAERKRAQDELDGLKMAIVAEAGRLGLLGEETIGDVNLMNLLRGIIDEGRGSRAKEETDALVIVELARFKAEQDARAGVAAEEYTKAEKERKALALARLALEGRDDKAAETMRGIAVARDAALAERVIAIRWLGANRKQEEATKKVLAQLTQDAKPLIAAEAKKAQE
ncbi:hypothetical protein ANRL1_03444 [Anaerolineae bacterium]|nr:hypothetical protein ANRL1_03444 [Anaerolineae bacterium]